MPCRGRRGTLGVAAWAFGAAAVVWLLLVSVRSGWDAAAPVAGVFGGVAGIVGLPVPPR